MADLESVVYAGRSINLEFHTQLITAKTADRVFRACESLPWTDRQRNIRANIMFGDDGMTYTVHRPNAYTRIAKPWSEMKTLKWLKGVVEERTGKKFTTCAVMRYPTGRIGIKPHRDSEMPPGSTIAGLSVGAVRTMHFLPPSHTKGDPIELELHHGSLYVMKPPTNDNWSHTIPSQPGVTGVRYSLTFRDTPKEN